MHLDEINRISRDEFVRKFGGIYESSAWVAEAVVEQRPFTDTDLFIKTMRTTVDDADEATKLALIRAHPDLAGKLAQRGELTDHSAREQSRLGLDRLEKDEFEEFTDLNTTYRERFGFPFIICVAHVDKPGILSAFRERLHHSPSTERDEALEQIHLIAENRVLTLIGDS
ncbi:MAG: 2-oxo-4-hydroxy-4-carboxy-5-ureidoimidazoline decarboxylase [Verrucomicrobiota bacterium]